MLFLNVHKQYRYISGAHHVVASDQISVEEIKMISNDNVEETEDLSFTDEEAIAAFGVKLEDLVFNADIYILTENKELKLRPYIDPQFFFYDNNQIGEEILAINENSIFEEEEPAYEVPVGTKVLCKVIIHNPDNINVLNSIESIWVKDRLNLVELPGNEIIFNHDKGYIYFAFTSNKIGVANLKFKDDKFITKQNDTVYSFKFKSEPIESLNI